MTPDRENIRFNVLRNALYHTARRLTFERWNRIFNFLVVLLGAAAMGDVLAAVGVGFVWPAGAVAVVGAAQLVFDFGRMARDHQELQRSYYDLLADIEEHTDADQTQCAKWYARMIRITGSEPPTLRAIDAKAYNDALDALGLHDGGERLIIPLWQRPLAGLVSFEGTSYRKASELRDAAKG